MPTEKYASAPEIFELLPAARPPLRPVPARAVPDRDRRPRSGTTPPSAGRSRTEPGRPALAPGSSSPPAASSTRPSCPASPASRTSQGKAFHTSRWDYALHRRQPRPSPMDQLADKRVGIIGTGATAVQVVPQLARAAKEVFVFQRTPSAVGVRGQRPDRRGVVHEPASRAGSEERIRQLHPGGHRRASPTSTWSATAGPRCMWDDTQTERRRSDEERRRARAHRLRDHGGDPRSASTRSSRTPRPPRSSSPGTASTASASASTTTTCRRSTSPTCTWSTPTGGASRRSSPSRRRGRRRRVPARRAGVRVGVRGHHRPATTGSASTRSAAAAVRMSERWHDGAHTLHGVLSAEFPNLMMISLVQAGFGTNFVHFLSESADARRLADRHLRRRGASRRSRPRRRPRRSGCVVLYGEAPAGRRLLDELHARLLQLRAGARRQGRPQPRLHRQPHRLRRAPGALARPRTASPAPRWCGRPTADRSVRLAAATRPSATASRRRGRRSRPHDADPSLRRPPPCRASPTRRSRG